MKAVLLAGGLGTRISGESYLRPKPMIEIGGRPIGEFSLEHIQFFTTQTLRYFCLKLGARPVSVATMALLAIHSGTLFGVFEWTGNPQPLQAIERDEGGLLEAYVRQSASVMQAALAALPASPLVIYGAGPHTARLLPLLDEFPNCEVAATGAGNPGWVGKTMGRWRIDPPAAMAQYPGLPVVVSSFRSQAEIARQLAARHANPQVCLYSEEQA